MPNARIPDLAVWFRDAALMERYLCASAKVVEGTRMERTG